jgi:hypothetical protein
MGRNQTTNVVNLFVWSLATGRKEQSVELPFKASEFVGSGLALEVDPNDGTIIVMGHESTGSGQHALYTADPVHFKPTFVASLGGSLSADLLGAPSAYDYDERVVYVQTCPFCNDTVCPIVFAAVELGTGKVSNLTAPAISGDTLQGLVYDSRTKRVYGSIVNDASGRSVAVTQRSPRARSQRVRGALGVDLVRTLVYFETAKRDVLVPVRNFSLSILSADNVALDSASRIFYSLFGGEDHETPYVPTDYCARSSEACAAGSSCCRLQNSSSESGYCFSVDDCSQIPPATRTDWNNYLVGVRLDDGVQVSRVSLCSDPGAAGLDCPSNFAMAAA